jgi:PPOX class probable F420-dependent enzyme
MSHEKLSEFAGEKYVNLATYRKNGTAVYTPVWFAEEGDQLYIYSLANAGKVKRIRNNPRIKIAPCDVRGKVKGKWVEAEARIVEASEAEHGHKLLNKKYGMLKSIGDFFSKLRKRERTVIAIRPV